MSDCDSRTIDDDDDDDDNDDDNERRARLIHTHQEYNRIKNDFLLRVQTKETNLERKKKKKSNLMKIDNFKKRLNRFGK